MYIYIYTHARYTWPDFAACTYQALQELKQFLAPTLRENVGRPCGIVHKITVQTLLSLCLSLSLHIPGALGLQAQPFYEVANQGIQLIPAVLRLHFTQSMASPKLTAREGLTAKSCIQWGWAIRSIVAIYIYIYTHQDPQKQLPSWPVDRCLQNSRVQVYIYIY